MAGSFGIGMHDEDNGDRGGRFSGGLHVYGASRHDQVHLEPHQVGRELRKPSEVCLGPAGLDPNVLALNPAELPQAEPEGLPHTSFRGVGGRLPQDTDPVHLRRLRPSGARRCEQRSSTGKERPPIHYSIT
jgi:hypothetical protein